MEKLTEILPCFQEEAEIYDGLRNASGAYVAVKENGKNDRKDIWFKSRLAQPA